MMQVRMLKIFQITTKIVEIKYIAYKIGKGIRKR